MIDLHTPASPATTTSSTSRRTGFRGWLHGDCDDLAETTRSALREAQTRNNRLEETNTRLRDDLQAAEHTITEVTDACTNIEYGTTEASIPDALRERLQELDRAQGRGDELEDELRARDVELDELRVRVHDLECEINTLEQDQEDHLSATLSTAWQQGRLARTLALLLSTAGTTAQRQRVEDAYDTAQRQFGVPSTGRITTLRTSGTWSYSPVDPRVSCPACSATRGLTLVYHLDRAQDPGQMVCPDGHTGPAPYWARIAADLAVQDGQAVGETECAVDSLPEVILATADQVLPAPETTGPVDVTALVQVV